MKREGYVFKVLLTAAASLSLDAVRYRDAHSEVLHIPKIFYRGNGFSESEWEMSEVTSIGEL
jgi:hypothetical protein